MSSIRKNSVGIYSREKDSDFDEKNCPEIANLNKNLPERSKSPKKSPREEKITETEKIIRTPEGDKIESTKITKTTDSDGNVTTTTEKKISPVKSPPKTSPVKLIPVKTPSVKKIVLEEDEEEEDIKFVGKNPSTKIETKDKPKEPVIVIKSPRRTINEGDEARRVIDLERGIKTREPTRMKSPTRVTVINREEQKPPKVITITSKERPRSPPKEASKPASDLIGRGKIFKGVKKIIIVEEEEE